MKLASPAQAPPMINSDKPPPKVTTLLSASGAHKLLHLFHLAPCSWPSWATSTTLQASVQDLLGISEPCKPVRSEDEV